MLINNNNRKIDQHFQPPNTQKGLNIITSKNTFVDLEVQEKLFIPEEIKRHTAHVLSGSKQQYQQLRKVGMNKRNNNREQLVEQHMEESHLIRRESKPISEKLPIKKLIKSTQVLTQCSQLLHPLISVILKLLV